MEPKDDDYKRASTAASDYILSESTINEILNPKTSAYVIELIREERDQGSKIMRLPYVPVHGKNRSDIEVLTEWTDERIEKILRLILSAWIFDPIEVDDGKKIEGLPLSHLADWEKNLVSNLTTSLHAARMAWQVNIILERDEDGKERRD